MIASFYKYFWMFAHAQMMIKYVTRDKLFYTCTPSARGEMSVIILISAPGL